MRDVIAYHSATPVFAATDDREMAAVDRRRAAYRDGGGMHGRARLPTAHDETTRAMERPR